MKKFLKCFSVYMAVALVLISTVCFPSVGASAAELPIEWIDIYSFSSPDYYDVDGTENTAPGFVYTGFLFCGLYYDTVDGLPYIEPGSYVVYGEDVPSSFDPSPDPLSGVMVANLETGDRVFYEFGEVFTISTGEGFGILCQSYDIAPSLYRIEDNPEPLYYSAFQMFANFIYGEGAVLTAEQNMVLTILATIAALAVVVVPFVVVWLIIRFVTGG